MRELTYEDHAIQIIPVDSGFYCKWPEGETVILPTIESALFVAESMIDLPDLYTTPKTDEDYRFPLFR
jgi:hypothetical protein